MAELLILLSITSLATLALWCLAGLRRASVAPAPGIYWMEGAETPTGWLIAHDFELYKRLWVHQGVALRAYDSFQCTCDPLAGAHVHVELMD